jgi:hypothetical protein
MLVLVAMYVCSTALQAQVQTPRIDFDCDAVPGSNSTWTTGIKSLGLQVQGTIEFIHRRVRIHGEPAAALVLLSSESNLEAGFYIANRFSVDLVEVGIINPSDPRAQPGILTQPWKGHPFKFTMTMSSSGEITITIRDKSASLKVNRLKQYRLSLSCSTAHVKFSDIVITPLGGNT